MQVKGKYLILFYILFLGDSPLPSCGGFKDEIGRVIASFIDSRYA